MRTEIDDAGVAVLTLDDADHRNALSRLMSDALADAVDGALVRDAGAIVLTAVPPVFCAGGALDDLERPDLDLRAAYAGFLRLAAAPVPTIAVVAGPAIGAGVNLPLACDVVLATPDARFDPRFLDVGIHPGGGHLWRLRERIGRQGAAALVLCGDVLTGEEAVGAGLVWRCLPNDDVLPFALGLAGRAGQAVARARRPHQGDARPRRGRDRDERDRDRARGAAVVDRAARVRRCARPRAGPHEPMKVALVPGCGTRDDLAHLPDRGDRRVVRDVRPDAGGSVAGQGGGQGFVRREREVGDGDVRAVDPFVDLDRDRLPDLHCEGDVHVAVVVVVEGGIVAAGIEDRVTEHGHLIRRMAARLPELPSGTHGQSPPARVF